MALNYIWIAFFLIAFVVALIKTYQGDVAIFAEIVGSTFDMATVGFEISLGLTGILCLWMGIMKIGEEGGSVQLMSKLVGPFFDRLFPGVPKDHPARGSMLLNMTANMLGLDNAATPAGLKAMDQLQELNPEKEKATNAMIMFLVLNTSGLTLIPVTVMTYRAQMGAENPADVFLPILLATFCASLLGLIAVAIWQKINLFNWVILAYLGAMLGIMLGIWFYFTSLDPESLKVQSAFWSNFILFFIICAFIVMAIRKKVNVYEAFIEGAKDGFKIAIKIIPYLVAILVAIGVFRASGALGYLEQGLDWFFALFLEDTRFTKGLPTAFMKPLSGSGARGMMLESWEFHGVDSFVGKLTSTLQGATDTTFYIIAVYFGAVGIKKTRYAVKAGLLADLGGIVAAVIIATVWFGHIEDTEVVSGDAVEVVEGFGEAWSAWEIDEMKNSLSNECVFYDQSYDTIYWSSDNIVNDYFATDYFYESERQVRNVTSVEEDHYLKISSVHDSTIIMNTFEMKVEGDSIVAIKYLGDIFNKPF